MEFGHKKVLIADDNKSFLMYMAILLKRMGFNVILAENGVETIKLMKLMKPDLVLLDNYMPDMDGISVLRFMKQDRDICDINVVMVTVDTNPDTIKKSESFQSCGFLRKPVDIDELHNVLQNCIFKPMGFVRRHVRIPFSERVSLRHGDDEYDLFAESLSEGGIYLRKKNPLPAGTDVEMVFQLRGSVPFTARGTVIYVKGIYADLFRVPPGMAIEFRDISRDASAALKDYIRELLARDIWEDQEEAIIERSTSGSPENQLTRMPGQA